MKGHKPTQASSQQRAPWTPWSWDPRVTPSPPPGKTSLGSQEGRSEGWRKSAALRCRPSLRIWSTFQDHG
uniref:Uncharacterized protein n=1 Tax=Anguilla anguilla TaxID=7936 RepID=A0A0E9R3M6_ANGAN